MDEEDKHLNDRPMTTGIKKLQPLKSAEDLVEIHKKEIDEQEKRLKHPEEHKEPIQEEEHESFPEQRLEDFYQDSSQKASESSKSFDGLSKKYEPKISIHEEISREPRKKKNFNAKKLGIVFGGFLIISICFVGTFFVLKNLDQKKEETTQTEAVQEAKKIDFKYVDKDLYCGMPNILPETKAGRFSSDGTFEIIGELNTNGTYSIASVNQDKITLEGLWKQKISFTDADGNQTITEGKEQKSTFEFRDLTDEEKAAVSEEYRNHFMFETKSGDSSMGLVCTIK